MLKKRGTRDSKANILCPQVCPGYCDVSAHVALAKAAPLRQFSQPICENGDIIT